MGTGCTRQSGLKRFGLVVLTRVGGDGVRHYAFDLQRFDPVSLSGVESGVD